MLLKLREIGINGKLGSWIGSFLSERKQVVRVGDTLSRSEEIISGVPQGSVLRPFLFLVYIQDMGLESKAQTFLYVDDSKVIKPVSKEDDVA